MDNLSITDDKLAGNAVTVNKLASNAVNLSKIDADTSYTVKDKEVLKVLIISSDGKLHWVDRIASVSAVKPVSKVGSYYEGGIIFEKTTLLISNTDI